VKLHLHHRHAVQLLSFHTLPTNAPVSHLFSQSSLLRKLPLFVFNDLRTQGPGEGGVSHHFCVFLYALARLGPASPQTRRGIRGDRSLFSLFFHSFSDKSFSCHSYKNTGGIPPSLSPNPPFPLSPLQSILTKTETSKSFESNTYKKEAVGAHCTCTHHAILFLRTTDH